MSGKPMELPVVHAEVAAIHDDAEKYGNNTMNASDVREDATEVVLDIRDAHLAGGRSLKLAKDGHTVLIPQPSEDPDDPVNWSSFKKHMILIVVGIGAFCGDFSSAASLACIGLQATEWNMTPNHVNYAGNLNVIMLAIGSLTWLPFIYFWGRAPVLLWSSVLGIAFTIGTAVARDFATFYACRALTGWATISCVAIGLTFVKDMFFFHEHARKIGIWAAMFLLAPYFGAQLGNFIVGGLGRWRPVLWMVVAVECFNLMLILLFADETYYDRTLAVQPSRGTRFGRLVGIWQIRNHSYYWTVKAAFMRLWNVGKQPAVILISIYYALFFMWSVGINITSAILLGSPVSEGGYGFGSTSTGYAYFAPVVGVLIGEIFGHFFNDWLARRYMHKHQGHFRPEARLPMCYLGVALMIPGLVIVGQALQHHLNVAAIVIGWGMYVLGVMLSSVAITAYALDTYPTASGELCTFINVARTGGGFATGYFRQPWGLAVGYDVSFGVQAAVVGVALGILIILHRYGHTLTTRAGKLDF